MHPGTCRFCEAPLQHSFCDLGMSPLSNAFLTREQLDQMEPFYPLHAYVCESCHLVQLQEVQSPEQIFRNYAYFSSCSDSWIRHAKHYTDEMIDRFRLSPLHQVIEIASNDGYLLKHFKGKGIPVLGIEPAENVAHVARADGIPTLVKFFGVGTATELVSEGTQADLLIGNNVLAHGPDLNDFVRGLKILLKPRGLMTLEFPHVLRLIEKNQFDTIYHEHFSYFSCMTVEKVFARHGLAVFDVDELDTHGGSLRIYARHLHDTSQPINQNIDRLRNQEVNAGLHKLETYSAFAEKARETKRALLDFLIGVKRKGKSIVGYGAPAKGNTLLNYCGIGIDFLDYTVDRSPHKQGRFLPGTRIPIYHPDRIHETKPDYLLILPWNLKHEIVAQMAFIRGWGGQFVVPIPRVQVFS